MASSRKDSDQNRDPGRQVMPESGEDVDGLCVEDVMTADVATVSRGTSVREAAMLMRDRDIGFLPVCEADGAVAGVVTDRDLVLGVLATDRPSSTKVEEVMTPDPVVCYGTDDLSECERLMSENQINRMIVLGDNDRLVGVVSVADLVEVESEEEVGEVVADVKQDEAPH
jgi:CBS domain-containing protein